MWSPKFPSVYILYIYIYIYILYIYLYSCILLFSIFRSGSFIDWRFKLPSQQSWSALLDRNPKLLSSKSTPGRNYLEKIQNQSSWIWRAWHHCRKVHFLRWCPRFGSSQSRDAFQGDTMYSLPTRNIGRKGSSETATQSLCCLPSLYYLLFVPRRNWKCFSKWYWA